MDPAGFDLQTELLNQVAKAPCNGPQPGHCLGGEAATLGGQRLVPGLPLGSEGSRTILDRFQDLAMLALEAANVGAPATQIVRRQLAEAARPWLVLGRWVGELLQGRAAAVQASEQQAAGPARPMPLLASHIEGAHFGQF